jgi:hypothetical protein
LQQHVAVAFVLEPDLFELDADTRETPGMSSSS